jgi:hypothetical protein
MEWQWEIQSSDNGVVRMEVTITALGRTEQEAKRQQKRIAVQLQQVDKLSFTEPFEFFPFVGKALRGVTTGRKGKPQPFYANHEGMWVGYMKMLSDLAPESLPTKGAMSKGCFLVVVADNGLKGLEVPVRLLPKDSPRLILGISLTRRTTKIGFLDPASSSKRNSPSLKNCHCLPSLRGKFR